MPERGITMTVRIKETGAFEKLDIYDKDTGVNWISQLIDHAGAINDGLFVYDDVYEIYEVTQETFDWWVDYITDYENDRDEIDTLMEQIRKVCGDTEYGVARADEIERAFYLDICSDDYDSHHDIKQKELERYRFLYLEG